MRILDEYTFMIETVVCNTHVYWRQTPHKSMYMYIPSVRSSVGVGLSN